MLNSPHQSKIVSYEPIFASFPQGTLKKMHIEGLDVLLSNPHLSFAAGFSTLN